jgi:hypothetical protein
MTTQSKPRRLPQHKLQGRKPALPSLTASHGHKDVRVVEVRPNVLRQLGDLGGGERRGHRAIVAAARGEGMVTCWLAPT